MKYNTLLVPVVTVAFATLAAALPTDASVSTASYPSDQGEYKPRPKAEKEEQMPFEKLAAAAPKLPAQPPTSSLPSLPVSSMPVNPEAVENRLPIKAAFAQTGAAGALPLHALPTSSIPVSPPTQSVPVSPPTQSVPFKALPTNEIPAKESAPTPGFLPKLPTSVPPSVPPMVPGVRRSHIHLARELQSKKNCGHLQVLASDNKFSGFVSADIDDNGRYTVVKNAKDGVLVDFEGHDLLFRDAGIYPALGATYGVMHDNNASVDNMQGNSANFAMLTGTSQTDFGKRDVDGLSSFNDATGASQRIESAIYWFGENNEIHATWINTNNQPIPIQFGVNPDREIVMSANVGQYAAMYGGKSARLFCSGN